MRKITVMFLVFFIVALVGAGCGTDEEPVTDEQVAEEEPLVGVPYEFELDWTDEFVLDERIANKLNNGEQLVFKLVNYDVTAAFFEPTRWGVEDAAEEFGVDAEMTGPTDGSVARQIEIIETYIHAGVDGLAIISADADTLTPIIDRAMDAGIPVVTSNIDAPESRRIGFFGQDLIESGEIAGEEFLRYFREVYPEEEGTTYKVALCGSDIAFDYVRDRIEGFKNVVGQEDDIVFLEPQSVTFDSARAYGVVEDIFQANPDVAGIYVTDGMIVSAGEYKDRQGLNGEVIAVGFNFEPGTEELLRSNAIQASVGQKPYAQGYEPIKFLHNFLTKGELPEDELPFMFVGAEVGNQENLDTFDFEGTQ